MNICIVTNHRNSAMFSNNLIEANHQLSNNTYIFELNYNKNIQDERKRLLEFIDRNNIELALFLNDFRFPNKLYFINEDIAKKVDCRLWVWDSIHDVQSLGNHINLYSNIYSIEINDVIQLEKYCSITAHYLPLYAGPEFYSSPREVTDVQDLDIFFIGTIAGSKKRLELLEAAAKVAYENNYKMLVLGRVWHSHHWYQEIIGKFKFGLKYPYLSKVVKNKVLSPEEVIKYYKRTKINLNIHIEGHTCYNCRTFEVMGNNNFLLSDIQNKYDLQLEELVHFDCYSDTNELVEKIKYYLEHELERNKIAYSGGCIIREKYNLTNALKLIFS
ncbi:glycosyltransferase [Veillonella sp.]|uniref:glycosyltransferase family protein n=1 Tax=Veillonella sp. TaxID=1926307 RepID=UPI003520C0BC